MKKLILAGAALLITLGSFAQTDTTAHKMNHTQGTMDHKMKDHVMMKDGKMMMMKDGKKTEMDKDMTMSDGTKVMKDGTVMKADGTKSMMKEGDHMDMTGKMMQKRTDSKMNSDDKEKK